jgi:chromate reductase
MSTVIAKSERSLQARVLGVAGSLRRHSWNRYLLSAAGELAADHLQLTVYDRLDRIPLFNEDAEEQVPRAVHELRDAVRAVDGLLIATPEYNHSIPGVLKNALDWLSREDSLLQGKPAAVIGATIGSWGTRLAQAALRQSLTAMGARVMPQPMLYVARASEVFDSTGRLRDASVAAGLTEVVRALRQWIAA